MEGAGASKGEALCLTDTRVRSCFKSNDLALPGAVPFNAQQHRWAFICSRLREYRQARRLVPINMLGIRFISFF